MHPARIAELLEPFLQSPIINTLCHSEPGQRRGEEPAVSLPANARRLTTNDLEHISTYIDILLRWNARINLTAIRDPEEIVTRHFGESLFAARCLFPREARVGPGLKPGQAERISPVPDEDVEDNRGRAALQGRVNDAKEVGALAPEAVSQDLRRKIQGRITLADLGSGAGFPGLPIKLWVPHISLTLIESNHKKAAFLREITRALTLTDVNIQNARAETLSTTFDVVTLRAVERFEAILPTAVSMVAPLGRLALLISAAQQDQARSTLPKPVSSGGGSEQPWPRLTWSQPIPIPESRSRILLVAQREH